MPGLMTRAEGVCLARNIIAAVEELDEILPADFSKGVHDRTKSTLDYMLGTPQFEHITEKMDSSLRNMWTGVQKWNRKGLANREMFYGLSDVIEELARPVSDEGDGNDSGEGVEEPPEREAPMEGLEDESLSQALLAGRTVPAPPPPPAPPAPSKFMDPPAGMGNTIKTNGELPPTKSYVSELAVKARENIIAAAFNRFHEKNIRVIDIAKIKHGDLTPVMKMTSSDRSQQLLDAAWIAGYISGAKGSIEEFLELLRKNGK